MLQLARQYSRVGKQSERRGYHGGRQARYGIRSRLDRRVAFRIGLSQLAHGARSGGTPRHRASGLRGARQSFARRRTARHHAPHLIRSVGKKSVVADVDSRGGRMNANWTRTTSGNRSLRLGALCGCLLALAACGLFMSEDALLKRAQEEQKRGELRAAAIDLKNLLENHPNNGEARFTLGIVDLESGEIVAATREFERARTNGVAIGRVIEPLVRAYQAQRLFDKALPLLDAEIAKATAANAKSEDRTRYVRMR